MDMNESISLPLGKIPSEVIDRIKNAVFRHSVGLIILDSDNNYLTVASGTFVTVRSRPAILTARHVIEEIKNTGNNLGLGLAKYLHKFILDRYCLEFKCAPRGESELSGPDMGLIYINDPTKLGTIKAVKSFFNLDYYTDLVRKDISVPQTGLVCVFGILEEMSDINTPLKDLLGRAYFVAERIYFERDGYDYYDFDFRSPHPGRVPSSLGGMSGGGVWHARVLRDPTTERVYVPEDLNWLILSGISFGESPVIHGGRSLRTHGPKSIYVKLFEWA